jgi:hypothetical protein
MIQAVALGVLIKQDVDGADATLGFIGRKTLMAYFSALARRQRAGAARRARFVRSGEVSIAIRFKPPRRPSLMAAASCRLPTIASYAKRRA